MKKYILATVVFALFFNVVSCQTTKQKFGIERVKYSNENGLVNVTFNLVNITNDTLYLSDKNLSIILIKNHKYVNWDYPKFDVQPFVKPVLKNGEQIDNKIEILNKEDLKDKLANNFATKLFLKNLNVNVQLMKYKEIIDLGFKHIPDSDPQWFNEYGYEYFRVEMKLDKMRFAFSVH